jgi:nitroimidazol reductase NimA-like FMN-containing flavoprotein (pyridoxamine 5'-phosphate oxidase superfamily)
VATPSVPPPSERTRIHRYAHRAVYDRAAIHAILDEGFIAHVGLTTPAGHPLVLPLCYGRDGDDVYLHGSAAARLFKGARTAEICVTVTLVDGIVVARSTYNTDINYRSVVVIGQAFEVTDEDEKRHGLDILVDHVIAGRSADARPPTEKELAATMLLRLPLSEASGKVRNGWTNDDEDDLDLPIWAGVVPVVTVAEPGMTDPGLRHELPVPGYAARYTREALS